MLGPGEAMIDLGFGAGELEDMGAKQFSALESKLDLRSPRTAVADPMHGFRVSVQAICVSVWERSKPACQLFLNHIRQFKGVDRFVLSAESSKIQIRWFRSGQHSQLLLDWGELLSGNDGYVADPQSFGRGDDEGRVKRRQRSAARGRDVVAADRPVGLDALCPGL